MSNGLDGEPRCRRPQLGRRRVARLMRTNGIRACRGKIKSRPRAAPPARRPEITDLVRWDFHADVPDGVWFTDITQIRTGEGWLYAAVILDAFNREIITWATDGYATPKTALRAFSDAIHIRRPGPGCIIHSDRGYQGGFNWSSQHLDLEVDEWGDGLVGLRQRRVGRGCGRLVGRRWRGVSIGSGSGRRSPEGCRVRTPDGRPACRRPWVRGGSVRVAACRRSSGPTVGSLPVFRAAGGDRDS